MKTPLIFLRLGRVFSLGLAIAAGSLWAASAQNFVHASSVGIGYSGIWALSQDVNGDGKPDVVNVSFYAPGYLTIATNNGDGTGAFTVAQAVSVSTYPQCVIAADINGDSRTDLIAANAGTNLISIVTNAGNTHFVLATNIAVGDGPRSVVAADFGRGVVDIISSDYNAQKLTVLTNNGTGVFGSNTVYNMAGAPETIIAADVNGDSKLDLIVGIQNYVGVMVLTNKGNGTFAASATYNLGPIFATQLAAVDLNGDHKLDIIVSDFYSSQIFVLTNNGTGQFTAEPAYQTQNGLNSYVVLDANNDGSPDIVSSSYATNLLQILTNNGTGVFVMAPEMPVPQLSYFLVAGDFNQDSLPDLAGIQGNSNADIFTNAIASLPPMLNIQTTTNSAILSWPSSKTNFTLQQNTNLSSTNWVAVPNSIGTNQMILPRQPGSIYFRLLK